MTKIERYLAELGISQATLAERAEMRREVLWRIVNNEGQRSIRRVTAQRILTALNSLRADQQQPPLHLEDLGLPLQEQEPRIPLAHYREELGWSQADLAQQTGLTVATISRQEQGGAVSFAETGTLLLAALNEERGRRNLKPLKRGDLGLKTAVHWKHRA